MSAEYHSDLPAQVRTIALELISALHTAETRTAGWQDPEVAFTLVAGALDRCQQRLTSLGIEGEANRLPSGELWKVAGPILEIGWLQNHARTKPRGYAGDYEMLAKICDQWHSAHPLGRLFDRYFQSQAAPCAVRNRTQLMADLIAARCQAHSGPYRVVSVGSGSGEDVRRAAAQLSAADRERLHVTLFDIDPDALEFATERIAPLLPASHLIARRENLFRLPRHRQINAELAGTSHLVYCTGLFDYLNVEDGAALLRTMWNWLTPGGETLAFNFTLPNPTRTYMEWIGNWYLIYRTREELAELAAVAGIPSSVVSVDAEAAGVNLFMQAQAPS